MPSAWKPIADGPAGIREIVATLNRLKVFYGARPSIRAAALRIAGVREDNDQMANTELLAAFVRQAMKYQADPFNAEFTQTPDVLLLQINRTGFAWGDCDDHCLLFASLAEALGIYTEIIGVIAEGTDYFNHVICVAFPHDQPIEIDLCAKDGRQPAYPEQLRA